MNGQRYPSSNASWLRAKQLAGSCLSPGSPQTPLPGLLSQSGLSLPGFLFPCLPFLRRAFSLPSQPSFRSLFGWLPVCFCSPPFVLLCFSSWPSLINPGIGLPCRVYSLLGTPPPPTPALALTPAPHSLYSSRPPGLPSISPPPPGSGLPLPPHLKLRLLPLAPLPSPPPHSTPCLHARVSFHRGGL